MMEEETLKEVINIMFHALILPELAYCPLFCCESLLLNWPTTNKTKSIKLDWHTSNVQVKKLDW